MARKGVSSKSELLDSLKVYLNNKNRLQPIIGLGSVVECVNVGARNREALYVCEVCVCRLSKADMRNHIMGSLHRYNYIKAWHPHLVSEWKENSDLSKLAWPLMEIARTIEGKEGAGDIQLLEFEDAVYQKMATHSENDAATLINSLRDWQWQGGPESQSETTPVPLEHYPSQPQRIVLLSQNQRRRSVTSLKADTISHRTSAQTNKPRPRTQLTAAVPIKSEGWLKNISTSQLDRARTSPEPSVLSENSNTFLDGYRGTEPLIGTEMLRDRWAHASTQKNKITVKGPSVYRTSVEGMPVLSKWAKKMATKRKMRKVTNTVFKVSLPLSKGSVLLKRTSFSQDSLPASYSHPSASDLLPSPDSQTEASDSDCDTGSFAVNHTEHTSMCAAIEPQQDLYRGAAESGQYTGPERNVTVAQHQSVDGYFSDNEYFQQSEDIRGTREQTVYEGRNYDRQPSNGGLQKQNEELPLAVSHARDWSSYNSYYGREEGYTEQWHSSASHSHRGTRVSSDATQRYYQQHAQHQYTAPDQPRLLTGSARHHGLSGELATHLDAARIKIYPHLDSLSHSGSIAPEPRAQFLDSEQRQLQTYTEFTTGHVQTAPQSYMMQPVADQADHISHGGMSYPSYSDGPTANPDQHFPHLNSSGSAAGGGGGMSQSNAFIPPVQALCYGPTQFMLAYPSYDSA